MEKYISAEAASEVFRQLIIASGKPQGIYHERTYLDGIAESRNAVRDIPAADVVPVEWVPVKERLPEPYFPVWAACSADGRENWVIETSYIPNPQSKSQWGPVPILETGRATVYAWAERHQPEAPKEG